MDLSAEADADRGPDRGNRPGRRHCQGGALRTVDAAIDPTGRANSLASGAPPAADHAAGAKAPTQQSAEKKSALREQALADAGVQTMLEVFPAEIRDVEEM